MWNQKNCVMLHSVRFISNDVIKRLVGKFQIFTAVAYFLPKIWNSRCLFSFAFFVIFPYYENATHNFDTRNKNIGLIGLLKSKF